MTSPWRHHLRRHFIVTAAKFLAAETDVTKHWLILHAKVERLHRVLGIVWLRFMNFDVIRRMNLWDLYFKIPKMSGEVNQWKNRRLNYAFVKHLFKINESRNRGNVIITIRQLNYGYHCKTRYSIHIIIRSLRAFMATFLSRKRYSGFFY